VFSAQFVPAFATEIRVLTTCHALWGFNQSLYVRPTAGLHDFDDSMESPGSSSVISPMFLGTL
jgi:hypothetical protein